MFPFQKKLTNGFYAVLSLPVTAVGFSLSTQVAVLSWILNTKYNLHIEDVALVWLAGPISGIIMQPIVGMISDKSWFWGGRRKPFIAIGGILGTLMLIGLVNIDAISHLVGGHSVFIIAVIVALLLDMSINVTFNPARSIIADVTPTGVSRTKGYSWMQVLSGSFTIGAYFISVVFGNIFLIYVAAVLVFLFSIVPLFFIKEPKVLQVNTTNYPRQKTSFIKGLKIVLPLYGFIFYAIFIACNKVLLSGKWDAYQTILFYICIVITIILGIFIILKGRKSQSNEIEFQKILLAHSFTWLGLQSMFVMIFFYVQEKIIPVVAHKKIIANSFSSFFTGNITDAEKSAGNILSLGLLIFNFVAAILPVLVLEPLTKRKGKIKTYIIALSWLVIGYGFLYLLGTAELNFYIGMFICGIGWSAVISIVFAIMSEKVDASKMGLYMGLFNFCIVFPSMMTVGVSKIINESKNQSTLFLITCIALLISVIFWLFVKEENNTVQ
ncbi:MAG: MFS transporter [Bacteroidetes bacterium]|nr:MFS transporter [Bacteroidota bacterium]MBS1649041.1 MFS transporter [Bacteroidota bacterium]